MGASVAMAWAVVAYEVNLAIIPGWLPLGLERMVSTTFLTSYFFYIGIVCLAHGLIFMREARAREVSALQEARLSTEAQLRLLKMELQPHFLFNTLHAISALMHHDVKAANEMLVLLADMLDAALDNVRDQEVTLQEELEILKLYAQIQQIRFGDRLQVIYDIDPEALTTRVPHLVLQPLVENAIKHGIANRIAGGRVQISARRVDGQLELSVEDDGRGLRDERPVHGLGLTNTRERLGYLYGDQHRFELCDVPGGGVRVTLSIPFRLGETTHVSR
jgi:LytS/YehU family sensor histidine kinase